MKIIIGEIKNKIYSLRKELKEIQGSCFHPKEFITKRYKWFSEYSGLDESNEYRTYFHCNKCDKRWDKEGRL